MGKNCRDFETHDFYCINCGNKGIPLTRQGNKKKGEGHRKNMYCYHCKHTVNHVECRSMDEVKQFQFQFANGDFKEEAERELAYEKVAPRLSTLLR